MRALRVFGLAGLVLSSCLFCTPLARPREPVPALRTAAPAAVIDPPSPGWAGLCQEGQGRCRGDRPEVCRGEGPGAAWWPVMIRSDARRDTPGDGGVVDDSTPTGQSGWGTPLECGDHGAVCSVEPDGMAVCVVLDES